MRRTGWSVNVIHRLGPRLALAGRWRRRQTDRNPRLRHKGTLGLYPLVVGWGLILGGGGSGEADVEVDVSDVLVQGPVQTLHRKPRWVLIPSYSDGGQETEVVGPQLHRRVWMTQDVVPLLPSCNRSDRTSDTEPKERRGTCEGMR